MAKGTIKCDEAYLRSVGLPEQTETYTVISHGDIIDKVNEQLNKNGFTITEAEYFHMADGNVARGNIYLECDKDPDMGMLFTWWNSYNKQVRFGCAIGALIHENKATLIGTEGLLWMRKHTGDSDKEAWEHITELIENGNDYFDKIIIEKEKMKAMPLTIEDFGCVMGALYFEHDLITPTQASATKQAYKDSDSNNNLWDMYSHLMYGIDGMDLKKWAKSQQKLHHMIMTEYLIIQEDKEEFVPVNTEFEKVGPEPGAVIAIGDPDGDIDFEEIPAKELSEDQIELIKEEHGVQESPQVQEEPNAVPPPEDQFEEHLLTKGHSSELVNYFMDNHYDTGVSWNENQEAFDKWAPEKSPTQQELEVSEVDEDNLVDNPEQLTAEVTGETESFIFPTDLDNPEKLNAEVVEASDFEEAVEEVTDMELTNAIEVADDDFEAQLEAALSKGTEPVKEEKKEEKKEEAKPGVQPVADLDKPVPILPPKEKKKTKAKASEKVEKKNPEGIKTKEEEDFLEVTAHDGLEVPAELLQEAAVIEKRMAELYGSVRPYQVEKTDNNIFVTIDESHESFYIPVE